MKLHLPKGLRTALFTCISGVTAIGATLSTGVLVGGVLVASFAGQAAAEGETVYNYTVDAAADVEKTLTVGEDGDMTAALGAGENFKKTGDGTLVVDDTAKLAGDAASILTVSDGVLKVTSGGGTGFTLGNVVVDGGAVLLLAETDALGYNDGYQTQSVTLKGTDADTLAQMQLTGHITLRTNLNLQGNSLVSGAAAGDYIKTFGGVITATGSNNVISAKIDSRSGGLALTVKGDDNALVMNEVVNAAGLVVEADTTIGTYSSDSTGVIRVAADKVLTITDTSAYGSDGNQNLLKLLTAADSSDGYTGTVAIEGTVKSGGSLDFGTITEVKGNYLLKGGLSINSWETANTNQIHHTLKVSSGGSLIAQNDEGERQTISILTEQQLHVAGGKVTASGILLGHDSVGSNAGTLWIESGEVNADYISMRLASDNRLIMTGGTLTFLSNPWQQGSSLLIDNAMSEVQLLGGTMSSDKSGVFARLNVTNDENTHVKITLGDFEFSGSNDLTLTNGIAYFTDTVTNNVSANLQLTFNTYVVEDKSKLDVTTHTAPDAGENGFGVDKYWLVKKGENGNGFNAGTNTVWLGGTEADGGTATTMTVANGEAYFTAAGSLYYVAKGEVVYGSEATVGAKGYVLTGGQLNVNSGVIAELPLTVTENSVISGAEGSGSAHTGLTGGITGTANLTIDSAAGTASTDDSHGNFFALSGDVDLGSHDLIIGKGVVRLGNTNEGYATDNNSFKAGNIVVKAGATLELYRDGGTLDTGLKLEGGTLRVQQINNAGSENLALGVLTVTDASVIDRNGYGKSASFSSLTGSGNLTLKGAGTTILGSLNSYTGHLQVNGGTLKFSDVFAISSGKYTSNTGGKIEASKVSLTGGELVLAGGTLSVTDSTSADRISLTGGTLTAGADVALRGNITLGAVTLANNGYSITLGGDGGNTVFSGTLTNNGTLVLGGTISVAEGATLTQQTVSPSLSENGFGTTRYFFVKAGAEGSDTMSVDVSGASYAGGALVSDGGNAYYDMQNTTYYVNEGTVTYNSIGSTPSHIMVQDNATLKMDDGKDLQVSVTLNSGHLQLANLKSSNSNTVTLAGGSNTVFTEGSQASLVSDVSGTGDLVVTGASTDMNIFRTLDYEGDLILVAGSGENAKNVILRHAESGWGANFTAALVKNTGDVLIGNTTIGGQAATGANVTMQDGASIQNVGDVTVGDGGKLTLQSGASINHSEVVAENKGSVTVSGGAMTVQNGANVNTKKVSVSSGSLAVDSGATFSAKELLVSGGSVEANATMKLDAITVSAGSAKLLSGVDSASGATVSVAGGASLQLAGSEMDILSLEFAAGAKLILGSEKLTFTATDATQLSFNTTVSDPTPVSALESYDLGLLTTNATQQYTILDVSSWDDEAKSSLMAGNAVTLFDNVAGGDSWTDTTVQVDFTGTGTDLALYDLKFVEGLNGATSGSVQLSAPRAIPEPATATLSLLALSALAARRRRRS